jgi:hypothetical protein
MCDSHVVTVNDIVRAHPGRFVKIRASHGPRRQSETFIELSLNGRDSVDKGPTETAAQSAAGPLAKRVWLVLDQPKTYTQIASEVGANLETVRKAVTTNATMSERVVSGGARGRQALIARGQP